MKLWMVDGKGWGQSFNVVRAATREDALRVAGVGADADVTELNPEGSEAVLWDWDYSPDSRD